MNKLFLIIGVLIFIVITYFVTVEITKQQIKRITQNITQEKTEVTTKETVDKFGSSDIKQIWGNISNKSENIRQVRWAEHDFEIAQLQSSYYKSDGKVEWTENGFLAHDYSMPRSKILDVNMNQKRKIKVIANMEGKLESDVPDCKDDACLNEHEYPFAEFAIYFVDSRDDYEIKYGIALFGTRDRINTGHARDEFKFDWFSVENTGKEIIFEDSSGRKFILDENSPTRQKLSVLNQGDEWRLKINSHVNGKGYTKLEISEIQIIK